MPTLAQARRAACQRWPMGCHAILSLTPVESAEVPYAAVDQHWRLYYNPDWLANTSDDEAAATILHEVSHLLLNHRRRADKCVGKPPVPGDWHRWNEACDHAVNSRLAAEGIKLGKDWFLPAQRGFKDELTAEQYYRLQQDKEDQCNSNSGKTNQAQDTTSGTSRSTAGQCSNSDAASTGTKAGTSAAARSATSAPTSSAAATQHASDSMTSPSCAGQPGKGGGGSCADGQQKPWEQGPPSDGEPGLEQHEAERIVQAVAKRIESSTRGRGKGGFAGWACEILNPKVDPRAKLLKAVRRAVEFTTGTGEYSYRRPSRRNPRPDMCLPSGVQPVPRITVVVDTSGSMGDRDTGLSLGLVAKVLNGFRIRDGIRVLCFDDGLQSAQRVFNPKQIQLAGRGGTDMTGAIVEAAKERRKPELIVVCTDGWTGWPEAPVGVPVVACITRAETVERVPKWIETISLGD